MTFGWSSPTVAALAQLIDATAAGKAQVKAAELLRKFLRLIWWFVFMADSIGWLQSGPIKAFNGT